jgi:predicted Ser/Thr protein kinase
MDTIKVCVGCGTKLAADAPQGLCPQCLLKAGLETNVSQTAGMGHFVPPTPAELAQHFPQLEIVEVLGQGGMGVVYKARQPGLDRFVALKILSLDAGKDPSFAQRFALEARSLARLNHPNIIGVYDFGQTGGLYYFIMEYVDGTNLREMIKKLTPKEALAIVPKVCEALQFAHDEGIVHRDIKPENILIDKKGRVKMADFGLAKLLGKTPSDYRLTATQTVMGTPHYMAPEQLERPQEVDHRADIYSLGVVLYEMLTGELPLGRFAPPSAKAQIDVRLDEVVLRTLENKPERRYQHASDLKTELETITCMFGTLPPRLRMAFGFEYRSKATLFGLPLLHVTSGVNFATGKRHVAKGIIAVGDIATGVLAFGGIANGVFAFGGVAIGVIGSGGVGIGLISFSGVALALLLAFGGFALGPLAVGGFACGYYAGGGLAFGVHAVGGNAHDPVAREFFRGWPVYKLLAYNMAIGMFGVLIGTVVPALLKHRLKKARQP